MTGLRGKQWANGMEWTTVNAVTPGQVFFIVSLSLAPKLTNSYSLTYTPPLVSGTARYVSDGGTH